jgi:hypothetical protein
MVLYRVVLVASVLGLSAGACRKSDDPSSLSESAPAVAPRAPAADVGAPRDEPGRSPKADISALEKVAAAVGLADGLPNLKPVIDKPFPDGATEEQVCEAVKNTGEKDLWVRFGHLVPMYLRGSIFIVQAKKSDTAALEKVVTGDGAYAEYKNCNDEETLIFSHSMMDVTREMERNGEVTGRPRFIKKFSDIGIKTLESFSFSSDDERLSDYCRADAELCEKLVKLDHANGGKGLCPSAMSALNILSGDRDFEAREQRCLALEQSKLACVKYMGTGESRFKCRANLKRELGLGE